MCMCMCMCMCMYVCVCVYHNDVVSSITFQASYRTPVDSYRSTPCLSLSPTTHFIRLNTLAHLSLISGAGYYPTYCVLSDAMRDKHAAGYEAADKIQATRN